MAVLNHGVTIADQPVVMEHLGGSKNGSIDSVPSKTYSRSNADIAGISIPMKAWYSRIHILTFRISR